MQKLIKELSHKPKDKAPQLKEEEAYLLDVLSAIYPFLRVYPESAPLFKQHLDITLLAQIYDQVLPRLSLIPFERGVCRPLRSFSFICCSCSARHCFTEQRQSVLQRIQSFLVSLGFTLLKHCYVEALLQPSGAYRLFSI